MKMTDKQRISALEAQVESLVNDINKADELLSSGDKDAALVQIRLAASRAGKSYLDCIGREAARMPHKVKITGGDSRPERIVISLQDLIMSKTVDEKAKEVCQKLKLPEDGPAFSVIRLVLKEQDRDTRHACAEAVLAIHGETGDDLIDAGLAHNACMNAHAV